MPYLRIVLASIFLFVGEKVIGPIPSLNPTRSLLDELERTLAAGQKRVNSKKTKSKTFYLLAYRTVAAGSSGANA